MLVPVMCFTSRELSELNPLVRVEPALCTK